MKPELRLSKAQRELLNVLPANCVETYRPAKKLVELGLAVWMPDRMGGSRLLPTAAGKAQQHKDPTP